MNSNHFRACKWLVEVLKAEERLTLKTIALMWKQKDSLSGGLEMLPRQFHRCKHSLKVDFGINICCEDGGEYAYYIVNPQILQDNNLPEWMLSSLATDEKLHECISLKDYIIVEPTPAGENRLDCVTDAMLVHKKLEFDYQKYGSTERKSVVLGICGLILYKKCWYILGEFEDKSRFTYALDRMWNPKVSQQDFMTDPVFNVKAYFSEFYGIFNSGREMMSIVLRAFGSEAYRMRSQRIHHSQEEIGSGEGYSDFMIKVRPNNELMSLILSRKDLLKVLSPESYKVEIRAAIEGMMALYV